MTRTCVLAHLFIGTVNKILSAPYFSIQSPIYSHVFLAELKDFKFRHQKSIRSCL